MSILGTLNREVETLYGAQATRSGRGRYPRATGSADPQRDAQMVVMRESGATLEEIGTAFGVTRERARQILKRNGYTGTAGADIDPVAVMRLVRLPSSHSATDVARSLQMKPEAVNRFLSELGRSESVHRLFRWRRSHARRARMVAALQAFVAKHGRSPYMRELGLKQGTPRDESLPWGSHLIARFGSVVAAFEAAGISRRKAGWRSMRGTHCRRGHEFTAENTYTYRYADGREQRQCRACNRSRA